MRIHVLKKDTGGVPGGVALVIEGLQETLGSIPSTKTNKQSKKLIWRE
jgi:hypothetical protein